MFFRNPIEYLRNWSTSPFRKPLVLRGARQVGKTSLIQIFSKDFEVFASLNFEKKADRDLFQGDRDLTQIWEALSFQYKIPKGKKTLLFLDEIQACPKAVEQLRYFYEEFPEIYVIAAGSLLENLLDVQISFPVGRVDFLRVHPFSFSEFLLALGESQAYEILQSHQFPEYAYDKMFDLFHRYALLGGMPEAIKIYEHHRNLLPVQKVYTSLLSSYQEDVEKYASKSKFRPILAHCIRTGFAQVGQRIKYENFGNSHYKAKEIKEALNLLEKAFLFQVIHPCSQVQMPYQAELKRAPRLQALDTGLVHFQRGIQKEVLLSKDLSALYRGKILEHLVGQEITCLSNSPLEHLHFWTRDKSQSTAEVDFVIPWNQYLIPVEVKAGATGRLRSLFAFMDEAPHALAIHFYFGKFQIEETQTLKGKKFKLIHLPYYAVHSLHQVIEKYF